MNSLSNRIAPHIPMLRRYARAITGSQTSGDAYVAAVLETLVSDVSLFPKDMNDRVAIYRLFAKLYGSTAIEIKITDSPFAWEKRAARNLAAVAPTARQAFILWSLEGFNEVEIAQVLDIAQSSVGSVLANASEEISGQVVTDIMVIEDEPLIAMDIKAMVEELGHSVTGIARTHQEAVALFADTRPKMVLADIQLADSSSGIDAVNDILRTDDIPVIFITAFPESLLTGKRPEPAFLVTKPFSPDMVKALISQALFFNERNTKSSA